MEAWIVADPDKLEEFYGKGFRKSALPKSQTLDEEPKAGLFAALEAVTRDTQKGSYGKIKHASKLLERVRASAARRREVRRSPSW